MVVGYGDGDGGWMVIVGDGGVSGGVW